MYNQDIKRLIRHDNAPEFEYSRITDNIYLGTNQCCQTHFDQSLSNAGITYDISIEGEHIDQPYGVEGFLWIPVQDHTAPSMEQIELGVHTISFLVQTSKKMYIHCKHGHGRGPTIVAAYLIATQNMSPQEAIEYIHIRRPIIHLDDVQIEMLQTYARHLKEQK